MGTQRSVKRTHVIQGDYHVSRAEPNSVLTTVLGSCISVCMVDTKAQAGGMNHFLLANASKATDGSASYGINAMELLINGLLKLGAERSNLRASVYGGARMVAGLGDIGSRNGAFALDFLKAEGIPVLRSSIGGTQARRISLWPATGRIEESFAAEPVIEQPPAPAAGPGHDVELF